MARLLIYPKQQRYNGRYEKTGFLLKRINSFIIFTFPSITNVVRRCACSCSCRNRKHWTSRRWRKPYRKKHRKCEIITWTPTDRPACVTGCLARDEPLRCNRQTKGKRNTSIPVTRQDSLMRGHNYRKRTDLIVRCVWQKRKWWILIIEKDICSAKHTRICT